jgi:hypothetical protein
MASALAPLLWDSDVAARDAEKLVQHPPALSVGAKPACGQGPGAAPPLRAPVRGGGATLEQAIKRRWRAIMQHHQVSCPWCEGEMRPRYSAAPLPVGARCVDCGATLT